MDEEIVLTSKVFTLMIDAVISPTLKLSPVLNCADEDIKAGLLATLVYSTYEAVFARFAKPATCVYEDVTAVVA